ncbi:MAG: hypothetical protein O2905_01880 [Proteobacteria bacterium]|nr:hypothetical protein [Pseudomonadota bacterium]
MSTEPNRSRGGLVLGAVAGAFVAVFVAGIVFVSVWADRSGLRERLDVPALTAEERLAEALEAPSLAVVPLSIDAGSDVDVALVEVLSKGIADRLSEQGLRVAYGDDVAPFRDKDVTAAEVAEALGVRYVFIGAVGGIGEEIRIDATLHDAVLGMSVFRGSFYGDRMTVASLHQEVVNSLLVVLNNIRG